MTITIEAKELEHMLIFASFTVTVICICYIAYLLNQNNK